ncbi:M28 family metallopeptidase [soil metagenome]
MTPTDAERRLRAHVEMLAVTIGERHIWRPDALARTAEYIRMTLAGTGFVPGVQKFDARGTPVENIEAILRGTSAAPEVVVVGAHYDTVGGSPGANDNGTGIASVLELARRFAREPRPHTLRFVAFVNEEPPFFQTEEMGSLVYARAAQRRGDRIRGMLSLETMGYYSDERGSQQYPGPLSEFFPETGNFIAVVGNTGSSSLIRQIRDAFTEQTDFPIQAAPLPADLPGAGWSDHWSFWETGYPAVMVTDTAPFRYPWYHTADDTPDKIDFARLAVVVDGLEAVVRALSRA